MNRIHAAGAAAAALASLIAPPIWAAPPEPIDADELRAAIKLPEGIEFSVYAVGLEGAPRVLARAENGDLIVTLERAGKVVLVKRDADGDGRSDGTETLQEGLETPHGLWLENDKLFVATEAYVFRFDFDGKSLSNQALVMANLPSGSGHRTRTLKRGPDGWLYLTIGSSCNVCREYHQWRATMIRFKENDQAQIVARGLRNTVGFDWQPGTGALYGVDNGRDFLGSDKPPEELNLIVPGQHYGWPFIHGSDIRDPEFGDAKPANLDPVPPVHGFAPHSAPLSITFLEHQTAAGLNGSALVALHGSWNSDTLSGYEIARVRFADDGTVEEEPFMTGCIQDGKPICRPTDVLEAPDGAIFVTDDTRGAIYRIARRR